MYLNYSPVLSLFEICMCMCVHMRCNSHAIQFQPFKVYNLVVVSIFIRLCNSHHYLISEHFHRLKKQPHIH